MRGGRRSEASEGRELSELEYGDTLGVDAFDDDVGKVDDESFLDFGDAHLGELNALFQTHVLKLSRPVPPSNGCP